MSTPQNIYLRWSDIASDPGRLFREMEAGNTVNITESGIVGYTLTPTSLLARFSVPEVNAGEAEEDMVSLRTDRTGIDNVVFVSTRGNANHAARIKIAVDPPDSLNAAGKNVSMALDDYGLTGYLPPHVVQQAKAFIDRNRDVLLRYWNFEIDTEQLIAGLKPPPGSRGAKPKPKSTRSQSAKPKPRARAR